MPNTDESTVMEQAPYLLNDFLIERLEVRMISVSGEIVTLKGLDWDILIGE